jgi:hypothetical protein
MRRSRAHLEDSKLEAETRRTYKGSARISLDVLYFQRNEHRDLDRKHVDYLKGCFQRDKCRRLEKRNHIEAAVDQPSLDAALRSSDVSARELLTNEPNGCPKLSFPAGFKLRCLHGQHRIQAAREFLLPHDKWWTVDLYTSGKCKCLLPDSKLSTHLCVRSQRQPETMPPRAAFKRGQAERWRGILQDTELSFSGRHQVRDAVEGLPARLQAEEPEGTPRRRGADRWV